MNRNIYSEVPSPCYVLEEDKLRRNLSLIRSVAQRADVEIILAFKAFALWKSFGIFREYISHTTASSPYEARLAFEEFGSPAHTYSPAYTDEGFPVIMACSSHISFNSLSQYARFFPQVKAYNAVHEEKPISCGLRVNPEYSEVEVELYNPCAPGTRFGVTADQLPDVLPEGIKGFHCHCHCESSSYELERSLQHIEGRFGKWFGQLDWLNLGGGHLMTRRDYDVEHLIGLLQGLHQRYPHLRIILEPGSAFAWQTGPLVSSVVDVVENHGIRTAILNVSFTCHMPDCLEMPYQPTVHGARTLDAETIKTASHD
ncbi:MAG: carboxynorspermidine decarboxylase, partial [Bacteroidaceae bacterium]|nr:carboxynorspermidine decarboxylase [Bacteroidaceae bacterium]